MKAKVEKGRGIIFPSILGIFAIKNNGDFVEIEPIISAKDYCDKVLDKNSGKYVLSDLSKKNSEYLISSDLKSVESKKIIDLFSKNLRDMRARFIELAKLQLKNSIKSDYLIIQAIKSIEEMDKVNSLLIRRLREWYELYNPEFSRSIKNNQKFAKLIQEKTRKDLLLEINQSEEKTIGGFLEDQDINAILLLANQLTQNYNYKEKQELYVKSVLEKLCPNAIYLMGVPVLAKMFATAGDLKRLALFPASTIQTLGAEKALFRHLKTGSKPPKYGFIINHPFVASAKEKEKGKRARILADKLSLLLRVDYFGGEFVADKLKKSLYEKFDFKE